MNVLNIAHRGANTYEPENTMEAFKAAIDFGCDGIELDVQFSKDGQIVVIHDETLERTTNFSGLVCGYTYNELQKAETERGYKIPLLKDVIKLVKEHSLFLNIELKNGVLLYPGLETAVINMLNQFDYTENIIISSFNHYSLVECKKIAPHIKTGALYMCGIYEPWSYAKTINADAIHPFYYNVLNANDDQLQNLANNGILINPFTINDEAEIRKLIAKGVSGIITDLPDLLKKIKDEISANNLK